MTELSIHLFGHPEMRLGDALISVDTRKAIALLAYLTITGQGHSREALAGLLWPDYDHPNARAALRRTLSALNKAIGPDFLNSGWDTISLNYAAPIRLDVSEFRSHVAECAGHGHLANEVCDQCIPLLQSAVGLYRGDFLEGFSLRDSDTFEEWQFLEAEALRRELSNVLERLSAALSQKGQYQEAIAYARRWLGLDPLREEAHRQLMILYARSGQHASALRQYRECVRILKEELDVAPLDETNQLYQQILEKRAPLTRKEKQIVAPMEEPVTHTAGSADQLTGREAEWSVLVQTLDRGLGRFIAVAGETGIGKTFLCQLFAEHAREHGSVVLAGRCYGGEKDLAYNPILDAIRARMAETVVSDPLHFLPISWLRELAWLIPELAPIGTGSQDKHRREEGPAAQSRFFEALRQVILKLAQGPAIGVLVLDDLHLADPATLDFFTYLVRRLSTHPILVIGAWSDDGSPAARRLALLAAENEHNNLGSLLPLKRFTPKEAIEMAVQRTGSEFVPADLIERVENEAEGLPFFLSEYLQAYLQGKLIGPDGSWAIPHGIRELLHARLANAGETERQLLTTAAVIGRSFDLDSLQIASGRSEEETVSGLESLVAHGLVIERRQGQGGSRPGKVTYDFYHEKLRALVYEETSLARRRLLHRRVAEALAAQVRDPQSGELPASQIAHHYQWGGQESKAAEYFVTAGERARRLHANREAIAHYQAALALGSPQVAELREAIGDLQTLEGSYAEAIESYEAAAAQSCAESQPRLEHKLGQVRARRGDWELAEIHYQTALDGLDSTGEPGLCSLVYADLSQVAFQRDQFQQAQQYAELACELAETANNQAALAQSHNILGVLARNQDDLRAAREHLQSGLEIAERQNLTSQRIAALNNLALVESDLGDHLAAIQLIETALSLCIELGDRHHEAALRDHLAEFYHTLGQSPAAMEQLEKAVQIFSEVGVENGQSRPEIWKLSEW
jgi:DNA-binding SARP family transcriptional activator